jgi:hypothetical protein
MKIFVFLELSFKKRLKILALFDSEDDLNP